MASFIRRWQKDFKASSKKDGTTKTNGRMRKVTPGPLQSKFSWDPDSFCSDSDGSAVGDDVVDTTVTSPVSVIVDLTGKTERLMEVSPAQGHQDVVLLSSGEEGESRQSKLAKLRRSSQASVSVSKVFLPSQSLAKDTLETLRLKNGASGRNRMSDSIGTSLIESQECLHSQLDETSTEGSVMSGPSSPHSAPSSPRCRDCRRLLTKMKRQGTPKTKKRDYDPASLSCDEWLLIKTWRPQRRRQERGRLWAHLKRIRKLAVELSSRAVTNTIQCSRPHVFLQRNLRRCRRRSSDSKAKPRQRRRHRTKNLWPPLGSKKRVKRKSFERESTLEQLLPLDLTVSNNTSEDQPVNVHAHHTESQKQERVLKHDISGVLDRQEGCEDLEGTQRILKFDDTLSALPIESQKPQQGIIRKSKTNIHQADSLVNDLNCFTVKTVMCEDVDEFRTPPDLSTLESKVVKKSHTSFFSSGHSSSMIQRGSFRSMLAVFEKSHNRVIKESHN